jgi:thiamine biosynthesis lipoprotein
MKNYSHLSLLLLLLSYSNSALAEWFSKEFDVMGTRAKVEFEHKDSIIAAELIAQVVDEMNRIDRLMSPYKVDSELSKVNRLAKDQPVVISKELYHLLEKAREYSEITNGAFDITFSSLGYLYDYRNRLKPNPDQQKRLVSSIDYTSISLNKKKSQVSFLNRNTKIDLGGIAKGHAVDQCVEILLTNGVANAFVNAGGDSRVIGRKKDRLWYIGVRHPRDENKLIVNLPLEQVAVSTSGDYERFFVEDGTRYHHIIDPNTGNSVNTTQSVTILANNSVDADALSTSVFVLGPQKGLELANRLPNVSAIIIDKNGKMLISDDLISAN